MRHPTQPTEMVDGVRRFKANKIVCYLLDHGGIDLNTIATLPFDREDREQFAQLIGYSVSGASDLSYMSNEVIDVAMTETPTSEVEVLRALLGRIQAAMKPIACELFERHPDDLPTRFVAPRTGEESSGVDDIATRLMGFRLVADPSIPPGEIHANVDGYTAGKIVGMDAPANPEAREGGR